MTTTGYGVAAGKNYVDAIRDMIHDRIRPDAQLVVDDAVTRSLEGRFRSGTPALVYLDDDDPRRDAEELALSVGCVLTEEGGVYRLRWASEPDWAETTRLFGVMLEQMEREEEARLVSLMRDLKSAFETHPWLVENVRRILGELDV